MFKTLQKIGKAFMLPIAVLPAAGLLLGIGGALSNPTTVATYPVLDNTILQAIFTVMAGAGAVVFENLALLLAVGLCIGLAERDKGTAALAGIAGFLVMNGTIKSFLTFFSGPDATPIDTGVVGSLLIGAVAVWLHNRYNNIELPQFLGFFGGSRFVPIVTSFAAIFVGAFFYLIWPTFQGWLLTVGQSIAGLGVIGTFIYGMGLRLTGAVGLHHIIYPLFWYTELGGVETVAGTEVVGAQKIFFAQLADPEHVGLYTEGTRYFAGRFGTMMFGLPGAALAMYHCVPKERRSAYAGIFFSVALTSFTTGITEPLEFMFLFVQPLLYVWHAFLDGISFLVADLLDVSIGNTFSGGVIDFTLFGILRGQEQTHWMYVIPFGVLWFFVYYFSFRWSIKTFNIATPGHLDEKVEEDTVSSSPDTTTGAALTPSDVEYENVDNKNLNQQAHAIIRALGGSENIENVDACITRLRVSVKEPKEVNTSVFSKHLGATGVLEVQGGVQAIYGGRAVLLKSEINEILGKED